MDLESIFISILCIVCLIGIGWLQFKAITYKPNNIKTARKLLSFVDQQKQFTIQPKNPYKYPTIFNIKILGFKPNSNNEYYVKYLLDGEEKTIEVDDFVNLYGIYYNL